MTVSVYEVGFAGDSAPRAVFLRGFCRRAQNFGNSAVAVHHGRWHFLRGAEADLHGRVYSASYLVVDVPVCWFSTGAVAWIVSCDLTVAAVVARPRCAGLHVPLVRSVRRQSRSHCCCFTPDSQYIDQVVDVPVVFRMPVVASNRCRDGLWVFLGSCTQVHGQGSPAIRAGKRWRGRRELAPRCSATQLGALRRVARQTPSCLSHPYHTHHTPHHNPPQQHDHHTTRRQTHRETRRRQENRREKREQRRFIFSVVVHGRSLLMECFFWSIPFARETLACEIGQVRFIFDFFQCILAGQQFF